MKGHLCLAMIGVLLPLSSGADMILHSKCTVSPGKTLASVESVFVEWRELFEKRGFGDYKIRLLIPHAAGDTDQSTFWIEGSSPNFERYGKAWEWWYTAPAAAAARASMQEVFTCGTANLFRASPSR
jgi:hypothetical protein